MSTTSSKPKKPVHAKASDSSITLNTEQAKGILIIASGILLLALSLLLMAYRVEHRAIQHIVAVPQAPIKLQQAISMGAVEVKLDSVRLESGATPFVAPAGKKFAVATIEIKNNSDKPIQIFPSSDMYMKNKAGDLAYITPYNLSQPLRAGELSPGERIKGELSFVVKVDSNYNLYIDSIWSGGVLPFATK